MKGKNISTGSIGFQKIREAGLDPGALMAEWQGTPGSGQGVRQSHAVLRGLYLEPGKGAALFFGFHNANCLAIHIKKGVCLPETSLHGKFTDGDPAPRI